MFHNIYIKKYLTLIRNEVVTMMFNKRSLKQLIALGMFLNNKIIYIIYIYYQIQLSNYSLRSVYEHL